MLTTPARSHSPCSFTDWKASLGGYRHSWQLVLRMHLQAHRRKRHRQPWCNRYTVPRPSRRAYRTTTITTTNTAPCTQPSTVGRVEKGPNDRRAIRGGGNVGIDRREQGAGTTATTTATAWSGT